MKAKLPRRILALFLALVTVWSVASPVFALDWSGESGSGGNVSSGASGSFSVFTTDAKNAVCGYRFTGVDRNGNRPNNAASIDVLITNYWSGNYSHLNYWKMATKYSKKEYADAYSAGNKLLPGTWTDTKNCYKMSDLMSAYPQISESLPRNPAGVEAWQDNLDNIDVIAQLVGYTLGVDGMYAGDKIIVEPLFGLELEGDNSLMTVSELAAYGGWYFNNTKDSHGCTGLEYCRVTSNANSLSFLNNFVMIYYPNLLFTPAGETQGLWGAATELPVRIKNSSGTITQYSAIDKHSINYYKLITQGYGVGICYSAQKDGSAAVPPKGTLNISVSSNSNRSEDKSNFVYNVYTDSGCTKLASSLTVQNGSISCQLAPGTYYVKLVNDVSGKNRLNSEYWLLDRYVKTAVVNSSKTTTVSFTNYVYGKVLLRKTSEDNVVAGIPFIFDGNNDSICYTTDSNGEITALLPAGTYDIYEELGEETIYIDPGTKTVQVVLETTVNVGFTNRLDSTSHQIEHWVQKEGGSVTDLSSNSYTLVSKEENLAKYSSVVDVQDFAIFSEENGYVFYKGTLGNTPVVTVEIVKNMDVIRIYYKRCTFNISLQAGTGIDPNSLQGAGSYTYDASVTIKAEPIPGYSWYRWQDVEYPGWVAVNQYHTFNAFRDMVIKATATPNNYTVVFDANASVEYPATGTMANQIMTYDTPANLRRNAYERPGYDFAGWSLTPGGQQAYEDGQSVVNLATEGTVTLYAVWMPRSYTVNFDGNGATSGTMSPMVMTYGVEKNLTLNKFKRDGYEFDGWSRTQNGSTEFTDGQSVKDLTTGSSITLYAVWKPISYRIRFVPPSKNIGSAMDDMVMQYGEAKSLTPNAFKVGGYDFVGWKDSSGVAYQDKQVVSNLTTIKNGIVYLYPQWAEGTSKYTVRHHFLKLDGTAGNYASDYEQILDLYPDQVLSAETGARVQLSEIAYAAEGFTYAVGYKGSVPYASVIATDGDVIDLYYNRNSYTVTLNKGTGITSVTGAGTYQYGELVSISAVVMDGFKWSNWTGTLATTQQNYQFAMPAYNVTDTANAVAGDVPYTVKHWLQKVDGGSELNATNFIVDDAATESLYGKTGGTTAAQARAYDGFDVVTPISQQTITADGKTVVNIYYTRKTFKVTVQAGTGISSVSGGGSYRYGQVVQLNGVLDVGYSNGKWTCSADATYNGASLAHSFTMPAKNLSLTASAEAGDTPYIVEYWFQNIGGVKGNYGSDYTRNNALTTTVNGKTGESVPLSTHAAAQEGFTFECYRVDGSAVSSATVRGDGTLVIQIFYSRNKYTVTLNKGTGISSVSGAGEYEYGVPVTISAVVASDYRWAGWTGTHTTGSRTYTFQMPAYSVSDTANASVLSGTSYTVYHYTQDLNSTSYTQHGVADTANGFVGDEVTLSSLTRSISGFSYSHGTVDDVQVETVTLSDGSLVVKLYYSRNKYQVTLTKDSGISSVSGAGSYYFGETVSINATVSSGYSWLRWQGSQNNSSKQNYVFTMPAKDVTYKAVTGQTTTYTVNHYIPAADSSYTLYQTESKTGTVGAKLSIATDAISISGYAYSYGEATGAVNGVVTIPDSTSLVVNLYYEANAGDFIINHLTPNSDGSGYDLLESETKQGPIGSSVDFESLVKQFAGYSYVSGEHNVPRLNVDMTAHPMNGMNFALNETWQPASFSAENVPLNLYSFNMWTFDCLDGTIYYSEGTQQYRLDSIGGEWQVHTWDGDWYPEFGDELWTDGEYVYCNDGANSYVLDGNEWVEKEWESDDPDFSGIGGWYVWFDGTDIYYDYLDKHYKLVGDTWTMITHNGLPDSLYGDDFWTDGTNWYYSGYVDVDSSWYHYVRRGDVWETITWTDGYGRSMEERLQGYYIWNYNGDTYYWDQYKLNPETMTFDSVYWPSSISETNFDPFVAGSNVIFAEGTGTYVVYDGDEAVSYSCGVLDYIPNFSGECVWTDGVDTYYSDPVFGHFVLDGSTWKPKKWQGHSVLNNYSAVDGTHFWSDGVNLYAFTNAYPRVNLIFNKTTGEWENDNNNSLSADSRDLWTDGIDVYLSSTVSKNYVRNGATWEDIGAQAGLSIDAQSLFGGRHIWTDGTDIYFSWSPIGYSRSAQYKFDQDTQTWVSVSWKYLTKPHGEYIWTDGTNTYYSEGDFHCILDGDTWKELDWDVEFFPSDLWSDGTNIYIGLDYVNQITLTTPEEEYVEATSAVILRNGKRIVNLYYEAVGGIPLSVDPNGGTWNGSTDIQVFEQFNGTTLEIPDPISGEPGYQFDCWLHEGGGFLDGTTFTFGSEAATLTAVWKPITYEVRFDGNGATSGTMDPQLMVYDTSQDLTANDFLRDGYVFAGWSTTPDGSVEYTDQQSVSNLTDEPDAVITLYAVWEPIHYTISFDANGGTGTTASMEMLFDQVKNLTNNGFSKTGYLFTGWNTEPDGTGTAYGNQEAVKNLAQTEGETVILYAQWQAITYTIRFDGNGHTSGSTAPMNMSFNETKQLTANGFVKKGYVFQGWSLTKDGSVDYTNQQAVSNLCDEQGEVIVLYAIWVPVQVTITFDKNGGTGGTDSITATYDEKLPNITVPSKPGYIFDGYYTDAQSGKQYYDNTGNGLYASDFEEDTTLYAHWTPIQYTIQFDGNGHTSGSTAPMSMTYDVTQALTPNGFQKVGYTFSGWNTQADGSGTFYTDKQSVRNLTTENGAVITLYAQWTANTYTIRFDGNGASTGTMADMNMTYDVAENLTPNAFAKNGYIFSGWNTKPDGSGTSFTNQQRVINLTAIDKEVVILYAQWKAIGYHIVFDENGATGGSIADQDGTYDEDVTLNVGNLKQEYTVLFDGNGGIPGLDSSTVASTFRGWQDHNSFVYNGTSYPWYAFNAPYYANKYEDIKAIYGYNKEALFMHWYQETVLGNSNLSSSELFNLKYYMANGGSDIIAQYGNDAAAFLLHWINSGYSADRTGIATQDSAYIGLYPAGATVSNLSTTDGAEVKLTAIWSANSTILPAATRPGYLFLGWNTKADGSGTAYQAGDSYLVDKDSTLYAQWEAITYTIEFNGNGADSGATASMVMKFDQAQKLTANGFVRVGYTFLGWNTNPDGSGAAYSDQQLVSNLTDVNGAVITLYAQWKANTYTIYFDANGGTGTTESMSMIYGIPKSLTPNGFSRVGYTFIGWNTAANGSGTSYVDKQQVNNLVTQDNGSITLYAQWQINSYELTVNPNGGVWNGSIDEQSFKQNFATTKPILNPNRTGYNFLGWLKTFFGSLSDTATQNPMFYGDGSGSNVLIYNTAGNGYVDRMLQAAQADNPTGSPFEYKFTTYDTNAAPGLGGFYQAQAIAANQVYIHVFIAKLPVGFTFEYDTKAIGTGGYSRWLTSAEGTGEWAVYAYEVHTGSDGSFEDIGYVYVAESASTVTWYLAASQITNVTAGEQVFTYGAGNTEIVAQWAPIRYTIAFDGNGGTGTTASMEMKYDEGKKLTPNGFVRTGYQFAGWNTEMDGSGTAYSNMAAVANLTDQDGETITLYAQWKRLSYNITYMLNDGTFGKYHPTQAEYDIAFTVSNPTRFGYTFEGWFITGMDGDTHYIDGETTTETSIYQVKAQTFKNLRSTPGTVIFQAIWTPINYNVVFDKNGGDGGKTESMQLTYDTTQALTPNGFLKPGYTFKEWSLFPDARINGTILFENIVSDGNMELIGNDYSVVKYGETSLKLSGVDGTPSVSHSVGTADRNKAHVYYVRVDYFQKVQQGEISIEWANQALAFANLGPAGQWNTASGIIAADGTGISEQTICLIYQNNGQAGETWFDGLTIVDLTDVFGTGKEPSCDWCDVHIPFFADTHSVKTSFMDNEEVKNLTAVDGGIVTLYAQWTANDYTIRFDGNTADGGSVASMDMTYDVARNLNLNAFYKTGYNFAGWAISPTDEVIFADGQEVINLTTKKGAVVTLYAMWTPISYTIAFDGNTATGGSTESMSMTYDEPKNLTPNGFTKDGYTFAGWTRNPDGTGASYTDEQEVSNLTTTDGFTITLYAQWLPVDVAITDITLKYQASNGTIQTVDDLNNIPHGITLYVFYTYKNYTELPQVVNGYSNAETKITHDDSTAITIPAGGTVTVQAGSFVSQVGAGVLSGYVYLDGYAFGDTTGEIDGSNNSKTISFSVKFDVAITNIYLTDRNGNVIEPDKAIVGSTLTVHHVYRNNSAGSIQVNAYHNGSATTINGALYTTIAGNSTKDVVVGTYVPSAAGSFSLTGAVYRNGYTAATEKYETNLSNNSRSYQGTAIPLPSLEPIMPNAPYRQGTEVITSYYVVNDTAYVYGPSDGLKVLLSIYDKNGNLVESMTQDAIVPANETQLVYFKWLVPEKEGPFTMKAYLYVPRYDAETELQIKTNEVITADALFTPDTQYESSKPNGWTKPTKPTSLTGTANWYRWEYNNGSFQKVLYGISATPGSATITPDSKTAYKELNTWYMKSGYGFFMNASTSAIGSLSGYNMPGTDAYTKSQYAYAAFPEYRYSGSIDAAEGSHISTLQQTAADVLELYPFSVQLANGSIKEYGRKHFTPIWFPDGDYYVKVVYSDIWTPMGMVTASNGSSKIVIDGNMYDDWYIS